MTAPASDPAVLIAADLADREARNPIPSGDLSILVLHRGDGFRVMDIAMDAGATMAEHSAPKPITVAVVSGAVRFTVDGRVHDLVPGSMITVAPRVLHELAALERAHVTLTLIG